MNTAIPISLQEKIRENVDLETLLTFNKEKYSILLN